MNFDNLIWRTIPYTSGFYQVSELGDIRKVNDNAKVFNIHTLYSSRYENFTYEGKLSKYSGEGVAIPHLKCKTEFGKAVLPISSLVYAAFFGIYNLGHENIFHLDGNEFNNSLDNIILCDKMSKVNFIKHLRKESNVKSSAYGTQQNGSFGMHNKKCFVSEYDMEGVRQNVFPSIIDASRSTGIPSQTIKKVIIGKKMLHFENRIFKMGIGPAVIDTHLIKEDKIVVSNSSASNKNRKVFQYELDGNLHYVYNNFFEASQLNNIPVSRITKSLKNKEQCEGYLWLLDNN